MTDLRALRTSLAQMGYEYEKAHATAGLGVHYTPVEVAEDVVRKVLRPLVFREDGRTPKDEREILDLKICDPALGAGVFMLETCFQLANLLPDGRNRRREIAQKCLFGTDIDPGAVALARDVLWRFCEDETIPHDFLDSNLRCADSLKCWQDVSEPQFNAIVGNPPYLGGRKIRRVLGDAYFDYLTREFAPGASGNADLCTYFLLLAEKLVKPDGICGYVTTHTISEGDSRATGLDPILARGAYLFDVTTFPWMGRAAVNVSTVLLHFPKNVRVSKELPCFLHSRPVPEIFSSFKTLDVTRDTRKFPKNDDLCFQGWVLAAKGFILTPDEAATLFERDARYREVVVPYFTGDDVFSAPDPQAMVPRRWVIHFRDWPLERAETYPAALEIVQERVLPVRQNARRAAHRRWWWQFGDKRPALSKLIQEKRLQRFLVQTRHAKYLCPTFVPTDAIYSESTILFPSESTTLFSILNSGVHELWVRETSSSLGSELRYSPTDCFSTFPLPPMSENALDSEPFDLRRNLCIRLNVGITTLYNFFHDPEDRRLENFRNIYAQNDRRVLALYGWNDLAQTSELHAYVQTPRGLRFTVRPEFQTEILHRLVEYSRNLNDSKR